MDSHWMEVRRGRFDGRNLATPSEDVVAVEEPLEMRLNGEALAVTMRTPGDDFDLVRGFLYTEQIIQGAEQILDLRRHEEVGSRNGNIVSVRVSAEILQEKCWVRNFYASSSCGVCGKASIEQLRLTRPIVESSFRMRLETLLEVSKSMRRSQSGFDRTGGLHAAVLFDSKGSIVAIREDIGRHNAVDKAVGWAMQTIGVPIGQLGLFVSGRTSFEILQKAIAAGIPLVAAISAPSSLAVELATEYKVALAGFVRDGKVNVYVDPGRFLHGSTG